MPLNEVQVKFVNEAARPAIEDLLLILNKLDVFVADYDAIQASADAIPEDATVLDDAVGGAGPRADAPTLTGANVKTLRDFKVSMSAVVSAPAKEVMIGKMVRSLRTVLGG